MVAPSFFVPGDGAQLWSIALGPSNGPTIVAVGGWAGSSELWVGPFGRLSASWRCIGFDHRGSGATVAAPDTITHDRLVEDVFAVIDAHDVGAAVLAAESAGAAVVLDAAVRRPERVAGLVLVDPFLRTEPPDDGDPFVQALRSDFDAAIAGFVAACAPDPEHDLIRNWGRQILGRSSPEHAVALLRAIPPAAFDPSSLEIPALLIHCEGDAIASADTSRDLAARMNGSTLHILPGREHVPTLTRPHEVASLIDAWWASFSG